MQLQAQSRADLLELHEVEGFVNLQDYSQTQSTVGSVHGGQPPTEQHFRRVEIRTPWATLSDCLHGEVNLQAWAAQLFLLEVCQQFSGAALLTIVQKKSCLAPLSVRKGR